MNPELRHLLAEEAERLQQIADDAHAVGSHHEQIAEEMRQERSQALCRLTHITVLLKAYGQKK